MMAVFKTFILSNFQYCPAMASLLSIKRSKIRKNQERAVWYVTNDYKYDYISLLYQASFLSLEKGRRQQIAIQTIEIVNNLSPPYLLITWRKCTRFLKHSVEILEIPFYKRVKHGTNSFSFLAPKIWKNLP